MPNLIRHAILKNGVVVNIIEYDVAQNGTPDGLDDSCVAVATETGQIGWSYLDGKFIDPNPPTAPVPPSKDELDAAAALQYQKLIALRSMSPAQVQAWVVANVTNFAQAQDAITTLAIAVSILARRI